MNTDKYFSKKFELPCDGVLPAVEVFFSPGVNEMPQAIKYLKGIMNHVKARLNNYQIADWSNHTTSRNPAQLITGHLKSQIRAEFVTQAFSKFFECVSAYPMVNNVGAVFQSVHLCEAPGAFVSALNHYMKQQHPYTEFKWRASTLNPYYEGNSINSTVLDDRLISHTLGNWIFGDDYDGDILKERNVRSLIDYCKTLDKISLVTSDGSIDCNDAPGEQESIVAPLHYAEFVTSLAILGDGGSMLIKMFTFYELSSFGLLYVLSCCFKSLHVFKPATSKGGNSECYVIAIGYKKAVMTEEHLEKLISHLTIRSENAMLALNHIPEAFVDQVREIANRFMRMQSEVIHDNIDSYTPFKRIENEAVYNLRQQMPYDFVDRYGIAPIRSDQKLVRRLNMSNDINLNIRGNQGSFTERQKFLSLTRDQQFTFLIDRLREFQAEVTNKNSSSTCHALQLNINLPPADFISFIRGRTVERVLSSKFILGKLVKFFTEVQAYIEEAEQPYEGPRYAIDGNRFKVEIEYFKCAATYEAFEKDVVKKLLAFILEGDHEEILIFDLPLFTQFVVGIVMFLSLFVFTDVHLIRSNYTIRLKNPRPEGKENLKVLVNAFESNPESTKAILGITDTQRLFSHSNEYYLAVIDYNNNLCLRFCSFYLNLLDR